MATAPLLPQTLIGTFQVSGGFLPRPLSALRAAVMTHVPATHPTFQPRPRAGS